MPATAREEVAGEVVKEQTAAGHRPYLVPLGASNEIGALGFAAAIEELDEQLKERRIRVDRVVFASSSGGTHAGLCAGAKAIGFAGQIVAIAIDSDRAELQATVAAIVTPTLRSLGAEIAFSPDEVVAYDGYLGAGYAVMGEPEKEAIEMMARYEGILLDPVYTGRALAGLIDLVRRGEFGKDETLVFWHTGGSAALFAYADQLLAGSPRSESRTAK